MLRGAAEASGSGGVQRVFHCTVADRMLFGFAVSLINSAVSAITANCTSTLDYVCCEAFQQQQLELLVPDAVFEVYIT